MILLAVPSYLSGAVAAVIPGVTVHEGDVPASPTFPYVLLQTSFPSVAERAVNRAVQVRRFTVRATIVGATARAVEVIADKVSDALEGSRLDVAGWNLGAMESLPNDQPILPDMDVTIPSLALHPQYLVLDWLVIGSRNPA